MERIVRRYRQPGPHGALIEHIFGPMTPHRLGRFFVLRRVNGVDQEWWNGAPMQTVKNSLREWRIFERRIGSRSLRAARLT